VISLPIVGPGILFPYGLAIGTCVSIINLGIISISIGSAVERGKKGPVIVGYIVRILLYAGAFLLAIKTSGITGLGAAIGFMLPRITLYIRYALLPLIRRKLGKESQAVYMTDTHSRVFVKEPWLVRYNRGRAYVTHRHFRKVRIDPETGGGVKSAEGPETGIDVKSEEESVERKFEKAKL